MRLAGCQIEPRGVAQGIACGMDFGGQPAFAAPDGLLFAIPPFAPVLCWCARTMMESIMAYSLSASCARCSKTLCQTPLSDHLLWRRAIVFQSPKRSGKSRHGVSLRGNGKSRPQRTGGYPSPLPRPYLPDSEAALQSSPTDRHVKHNVAPFISPTKSL